MTKFYDITLPLSSHLPIWPGDREPIFKHKEIEIDGNAVQVSKMDMPVHTGTHVDAPLHFIQGGNPVEYLPLEALIGPVEVILLPNIKAITADLLKGANIPKGTRRLLFKTDNSKQWTGTYPPFMKDFACLHADGAAYLVDQGIILVGIDYLSIAPFNNLVPTHRTLLEANVVIIEGLDLSKVDPGLYTLHCLPLKIVGADGAPARVILTK